MGRCHSIAHSQQILGGELGGHWKRCRGKQWQTTLVSELPWNLLLGSSYGSCNLMPFYMNTIILRCYNSSGIYLFNVRVRMDNKGHLVLPLPMNCKYNNPDKQVLNQYLNTSDKKYTSQKGDCFSVERTTPIRKFFLKFNWNLLHSNLYPFIQHYHGHIFHMVEKGGSYITSQVSILEHRFPASSASSHRIWCLILSPATLLFFTLDFINILFK